MPISKDSFKVWICVYSPPLVYAWVCIQDQPWISKSLEAEVPQSALLYLRIPHLWIQPTADLQLRM